MHILLGIISAIGAIVFFLYRLGFIFQIGKEAADSLGTAAGAVRRARIRKKANASPLTQIEDPREAVSALMVAIAKADGDLTERQIKFMEKLIAEKLEVDKPADLLAHGRWLANEAAEPGQVVMRVSRFLAQKCDDEQKADVLDILKKVAALEGEPSNLQLSAINQLRHNMGVVGGHN